MEFALLPGGVLMGFSMAVGVGPVNVLCLRNSLTHGFRAGIVSGLGAAVADTLFSAAIALGAARLADWFELHRTALQLVAALFLIVWGARVMVAVPPALEPLRGGAWRKQFIAAFGLTFFNPFNLAALTTVAGGLGLIDGSATLPTAATLAMAVFVGGMTWWLLICTCATASTKWFNDTGMVILNRSLGALLAAGGVGLGLSI